MRFKRDKKRKVRKYMRTQKKLILSAVMLCILTIPALSSQWVLAPNSKSAYDLESMQFVHRGKKLRLMGYWQKLRYSDGTFEKTEMAIDCKERSVYVGSRYVYDKYNNCIEVILADKDPTAYAIAPDTLAMDMYKTYCEKGE